MCKYCDDKHRKTVFSYNNADSMNISYGQYQGVRVYSRLEMQGNVLFLSGSGSYRSKGDCYYESEWLDCDDEYARNSKESYIKIDYCPFCGKKIDSNLYDILKLKEQKSEIKEKIKVAERRLSTRQIVCQIGFEYYHSALSLDFVLSQINVDHLAEDMSFNELIESSKVSNIKVYIDYGFEPYYYQKYNDFENFSLDLKLKASCYEYLFKTKLENIRHIAII